jgi:hypothetical protein
MSDQNNGAYTIQIVCPEEGALMPRVLERQEGEIDCKDVNTRSQPKYVAKMNDGSKQLTICPIFWDERYVKQTRYNYPVSHIYFLPLSTIGNRLYDELT